MQKLLLEFKASQVELFENYSQNKWIQHLNERWPWPVTEVAFWPIKLQGVVHFFLHIWLLSASRIELSLVSRFNKMLLLYNLSNENKIQFIFVIIDKSNMRKYYERDGGKGVEKRQLYTEVYKNLHK